MAKNNSQITELSVLIPTYNHRPDGLIRGLINQLTEAVIIWEIILFDDASPSPITLPLHHPNLNLVRTENNLGRAKARNRLADLANYELLLFIDADADITQNPKFIVNYLAAYKPNKVLEGGVAYANNKPPTHQLLRYNFGKSREALSAKNRQNHFPKAFSTFNLLIPKSILQHFPFEEKLIGYGYEDTLWGLEVKQANIEIICLNNPLIHTGLSNNQTFLTQTNQAIDNLIRLNQLIPNYQSALYTFAIQLKPMPLFVINLGLYITKKALIAFGGPLVLFDVYKLFRLIFRLKQLDKNN